MMKIEVEREYKRFFGDRITNIACEVASQGVDRLGWISKQFNEQNELNGWVITVGDKCARVSEQQFTTLDDEELVRIAFKEAYGFEIDSKEHIQYKINYYSRCEKELLIEFSRIQFLINGLNHEIERLNGE